MNVKYLWIAGEPDLHEMLHDDVVRALMDRDGVSHEDLGELISRVQRRLSRQHAPGSLAGRMPAPATDTAQQPGM